MTGRAAAISAKLREDVRRAYSTAAEHPEEKHAFPVGRAFAASIGYPLELLGELPAAAVEAFAGVSNVSLFADLPCGSAVLDVGCGAGLDSLIAARRVGSGGHVYGIDFSEPMLARGRLAAAQAGLSNVELRNGEAEGLPFPAETFDVAMVNGIFNLNPGRALIFPELFRVLRPGGSVFAAELILMEALSLQDKHSPSNWFA
jgi:SAM-dependent methyltransferase